MARTNNAELNDYERQRQENIAKNKALFQQLQLDAASTGIGPKKASSKPASSAGQKRKRPEKRIKEEIAPRRTSSRLRGIVADSEVAQQKAEEERVAFVEAEKAKRQRVSGDLNLGDVIVNGGQWNQSGNFLSRFGPANPGERTFSKQDVKNTSDKELRALRERISGLSLWKDIEPARIKITPERIYFMGFHPSADKPLVFAGDKMGNLGLFDGSQDLVEIKAEDDDEEDGIENPVVSSFKIHTRTISAFQFAPNDPAALYSASYDSSIRKLDLNKGVAVEVWAPPELDADEPLSGVEISRSDPNMLFFTSLEGRFGMHDLRTSSKDSQSLMQLSEKKIGGFTLHPIHSHLVATASLDRCLKLWDLRKISGKGASRLPVLVGEHESKLSVSHAAFNSAGQVATASYDDTVKIYDFSKAGSWKAGHTLSEEEMKPRTVIPHNNQTGRWVTILRAQWQMQPQDGVQRFCIGNMNRFVDVYTSKGEQLAQLGGDGISAVPAVAQFHPTQDWIAAGTASGKLCLWM
ncbi:WD repeat-containing protein [Myriangium duriaei CBS 260.36]|uniref:DNA damage-binding protein CMR1 n=1 Tax=Myriangium duriaei CBS 260.36 TaxID=1168546 RepID=A0A9P4IZI7_9PEZI|nr:WD repeat-containing protein [Myriangium duriaei CBS 260.36]